MLLRDVISAADGNKLLISFDCNWDIDGDYVGINPIADLSLDAEVTIEYYWYDHLHPDFRNKKVYEIFENHDWDEFQKIFKKAQEQMYEDGFCYMPYKACLCIGDDCVGEVSITHKPFFMMLTIAEHECG